MSSLARRAAIVGIALVVIVGAICWVSWTFTDRSYACGSAIGEARHGETVPDIVLPPDHLPAGGVAITIDPGGNAHFVTVCRGQARARLAESGLAIALALLGAGLALRRRRPRPPNPGQLAPTS